MSSPQTVENSEFLYEAYIKIRDFVLGLQDFRVSTLRIAIQSNQRLENSTCRRPVTLSKITTRSSTVP